jgi:hypothetical protein
MRILKPFAIVAGLTLFVSGCTYIQIRIIHDCGWFALLKGSEVLWLFGACHH